MKMKGFYKKNHTSVYLSLGLILAFVLGAGLVYYVFPHEIEIEKEKIVYVDKIVEVEKIVKVTKLSCPNDPDQPRIERNTAYIEQDGVLVEAGTSYSNEPSKCAKLHKVNCNG